MSIQRRLRACRQYIHVTRLFYTHTAHFRPLKLPTANATAATQNFATFCKSPQKHSIVKQTNKLRDYLNL